MNQHTLLISKVINGGYGLGQLSDGRLAMVRQVLPGEEIVMTTEAEKKSYLLGRPSAILRPSRHRVEPPCPYYGVCGGCDLQHADYAEQLRIKHGILLDLLARQTGLPDAALPSSIALPLPSPQTFGYRQRIRLWVKDGASLGFRQHRSHDIVVIERCLIARNELNDALAALSAHRSLPTLLANTTELELLWNPVSGMVTSLFHLTRKPRSADISSAAALQQEIAVLERVFFSGPRFPLTAGAPAGCHSRLGIQTDLGAKGCRPFVMEWEVGGFCQVNFEQNRNLVDLVSKLAAVRPEETVLDLFCGAGNFSLPLAASARTLLGIEGQGAAIRCARRNGENAGLSNTTFRKQLIQKGCRELTAAGKRFDVLVIDPPREGIPGLAATISALCRSRLVYISCDPATLSRDLADLTSAGLRITAFQPVDMFPQTHHIETVVLLEKH